MAIVISASSSNTNQSQPSLSDTRSENGLRDVSFSYLDRAEETFVCNLVKENLYAKISNNNEDGEIGVFGAEKYFNGLIDESRQNLNGSTRTYHYKKDRDQQEGPIKPKIQSSTPSVRSESSWSSQSALVHNTIVRNASCSTKKKSKKNFLSSFSCKCSCSNKSSVNVDEDVGEIVFNKSPNNSKYEFHGILTVKSPVKTDLDLVDHVQYDGDKFDKMGTRLNGENCFTFQTSKLGKGNLKSQMELQFQEEEKEGNKERNALKVSGSPVTVKRNHSLNLERRFTMLSWDNTINLRAEETEFFANSGKIYNETESDASSDLFEIESLEGKSNTFGCVTPTTCYAPSEVSIEWSVVTASAADFSAMSDFDEQIRLEKPKAFSKSTNSKADSRKQIPKPRPGVILGCKSQKAVRVAEDAYGRNDGIHSRKHQS